MELQLQFLDHVTVIEPIGRIDVQSIAPLRERVQQVLAEHNANLVINLSQVSFMDSSGLAVLIQGMRQCRLQGGDLHLCNPPLQVRMVLELTRLDKALAIFADESEAIASFVV